MIAQTNCHSFRQKKPSASRNGWVGLFVGLVVGMVCQVQATAAEKYNELEDAAVAQAKIWQAGGKARPLMSSDGKVVFAFGQSMPKLTCSPLRSCDVEMEPGEKVKKVILSDKVNWTWDAAESIEHGKTVQHVVFQPRDNTLETNTIITTDHRTYHIKLYAPKEEGVYLNRIGFYYPSEMVTSWADKMGVAATVEAKDEGVEVMSAAVSPEKLAFDYRVTGDADFKPEQVFSDGERVYMKMPASLRNGENPLFFLINEKGKEMEVNYRREVDQTTGVIHYVVDKLFANGELRGGSETVKISWKRKEKTFWGGNRE